MPKGHVKREPPPETPFLSSPIQRSESGAEVARRLLSHVTSGEVHVGQRLPSERQLAESLGVGRSSIREALAALDLIGIVTIKHGSGTYLSGSASDLLPKAVEWGLLVGRRRLIDLVDARQYMEVITAGRAAERITPESAAELTLILEEMKTVSDDPALFVEADIRFHFLIADISNNSVLTDSLTSIRALLRVWIERAVDQEDGLPSRALKEHAAILEAIVAGSREQAEGAMRAHMDSAAKRLRQSLLESTSADKEMERPLPIHTGSAAV